MTSVIFLCRSARDREEWNERLEILNCKLYRFFICQCIAWLQEIFRFIWLPCWSFNSEHPVINGFKCLFTEDGFSRVRLKSGFPPILLVGSCYQYSQPAQTMNALFIPELLILVFTLCRLKSPKFMSMEV